MASGTLEHLVIPVFEEADLTYHFHSDGQAITITMNSRRSSYRFVINYQEKAELLIVACWNITRFDLKDMATAIQLANSLNRIRPGKFTIDEEGALDFIYEISVTERTTPDDFADVFDRAVNIVDGSFETIMKTRWTPKPRNGGSKRKHQDPSKHDKGIAQLIEEALNQDD
jgi:hypothetical protein